MNVLFLGDVVSETGRNMIATHLEALRSRYAIDFVIANGENVAHGKGITTATYEKLVRLGIDAITLGNHYITRQETDRFYTNADRLVRPYNLHPSAAGVGTRVFDVQGVKLRVTNILGRVFIRDLAPANPFDAMEEILLHAPEPLHIVDFHAEATGEKMAFGWNFDGKVSAIIGTHTHVQTTDSRILPQGTAYLSDVGMTGPYNGVIGAKKEEVIYRTRTGLPARFDVADGPGQLSGVVLTFDNATGKATAIRRLQITPDLEYYE